MRFAALAVALLFLVGGTVRWPGGAVGGAADLDYTPTTPGDWTDPDPTTVEEGLDDLAARPTGGGLPSDPDACPAGPPQQFVTDQGTTGTLTCDTIADGDVPDDITVDNAGTADALTSNPTDCGANEYANAIAANGNLTCGSISDADVPDTITIDAATTALTASALAANGANCPANEVARGVDDAGVAECSAVSGADLPDVESMTTSGGAGTVPTSDGAGNLSMSAGLPTGSRGDVLYHNGTTWTSLGAGTSGQFLQTQGAGANPVWADPSVQAGTAYYVDATTGDDGDDGLSPANAWATLSQVNGSSFNPGDTIYLKRGETWRETLTVPDSGTSGSPITIGAYGAGDAPLILASTDASETGDWTDAGSDLWYAGYSTEPNAVWRNGVRMTEEGDSGDLDAYDEWYNDTGNSRVYVFSDGATNPVSQGGTNTFEFGTRTSCITGTDQSHVTVNGIDCSFSNQFLVNIDQSSTEATDWTVESGTFTGAWQRCIVATSGDDFGQFAGLQVLNNTISDCGGDTSTQNDAIEVQYADRFRIDGNTITVRGGNNGYGSGIHVFNTSDSDTDSSISGNTIQGTGGVSGIRFDNASYIDLVGNTITAILSGAGIWGDENNTDTYDGPDHCLIARNLIAPGDGEHGIHLERSDDNSIIYNVIDVSGYSSGNKAIWLARDSQNTTIYNNTIVAPNPMQFVHLGFSGDPVGDDQAGTVVKNNLFFRSSGNYGGALWAQENGGPTTTGIDIDYNLYGDASESAIVNWFGTFYSSIPNFNSAQGHETNHADGDPVFVGGGYHLDTGSPAENAGVSVGLITDYDGNAVSDPPEIGAFECDGACP